MDAEHLAALLDGRQKPGARAATLGEVAASDEAAAVLADAAAMLREREARRAAAGGGADVPLGGITPRHEDVPWRDAPRLPPPQRGWRWHTGRGRWLAAAAVLVMCVTPLVVRRRPAEDGRPAPFDPVAMLSDASRRQSVALAPVVWSGTRSDEAVLSPEVRASRLGVRLADAELAAERGDTAAVRRTADEVAALLTDLDAGTVLAAGYRRVGYHQVVGSANPADSLRHQRELLRTALGPADGLVLDIAAWAQAARAAAAAGDARFLGAPGGRALLDTAAARFAAGTPVGDAVRRVRRLLTDPSKPPRAVQAALDALVAALTG